MADGDESPNLNSHLSNGCASSLDFSNVSAANVSSNSISKFWSLAQNLTRSVFTRSGSQPAPTSTTHPRKERPIRSYEGYVSNDEEDFESRLETQPMDRNNLRVRIPDGASETVPSVNKRPFPPAVDEPIAVSAAKRSKVDEQSMASRHDLSSTFRSHHRFWTSDASAPRPLYRPSSISTSKPIQMSFLNKVQSRQDTPVNVFSVAPRALSRPMSAASTTSGTASLSSFSAISEISRKTAARNSETKRILLDLERVGGLPTPDSKRPRLWFQSVSEETQIPRMSEKKRTPFGPPTTTLRTTDRAQVLPTVITAVSEPSWQRPIRSEQAPPIPAAVKRGATGEASGQFASQETAPTLFGKQTLPSACKFTFSKPLPVACSTDKAVPSIPDISRSTMVPFSAAQSTPPTGSSLQFSKASLVSAATSTTDSRPLSATDSAGPWNTTDKITFEDYKKAAKWKCASCHFNNNPDDNSCRQCFGARSSMERGNVIVGSEATWRCSKCQLDNTDSLERCKSCQASKTGGKPGGAEGSTSAAKWSCSTCFVSNDGSVNECACCKTVRPVKQVAPAATSAVAAKWSCSECFVSNDGSANECVCCKTAKPKKEAKPAGGEKWWCSSCSVKNDAAVAKCVACGSERTQQVKQPLKSGSGESTITPALSSKPKWSCSTCFVSNDGSVNECACCKTARPNQAQSANAIAVVPVQPKETTKPEAVEKKPINWSCTTCFLSNSADRVKCIACQSPKPGAAFKPVRLGASLFGSIAGTGSTNNTPSPAFPAKFGITSDLAAKKPEISTIPLFGKTSKESVFPAATSTAAPIIKFGINAQPSTSGGQQQSVKFGAENASVGEIQPSEKATGATILKAAVSGSQTLAKPIDFGTNKPAVTDGQSVLGDSLFGQKTFPSSATGFTFGQKPTEMSTPGSGGLGKLNGDHTTAVTTTTTSTFSYGQLSEKAAGFDSVKKTMSETKLAEKAVTFDLPKPTTTESQPTSTASAFGLKPFGGSTTGTAPFTFGQKPAEGSTFTFGSMGKTNGGMTGDKTTTSTAMGFPTSFNLGKTNGDAPLFAVPKNGQASEKTIGNDVIKKTMSESQLSNKGGFDFALAKTGAADGQASSNVISFGTKAIGSTATPFTFGGQKAADGAVFSFGAPKSTGGADGTSTTTTAPLAFPSFTGSSTFGMEKANGSETKSAASIVFPTLPTTNLFGVDKSANGSGSSPALPFPSLPVSSNPFSVNASSAGSPISGRRQLVAKRKAKRM